MQKDKKQRRTSCKLFRTRRPTRRSSSVNYPPYVKQKLQRPSTSAVNVSSRASVTENTMTDKPLYTTYSRNDHYFGNGHLMRNVLRWVQWASTRNFRPIFYTRLHYQIQSRLPVSSSYTSTVQLCFWLFAVNVILTAKFHLLHHPYHVYFERIRQSHGNLLLTLIHNC